MLTATLMADDISKNPDLLNTQFPEAEFHPTPEQTVRANFADAVYMQLQKALASGLTFDDAAVMLLQQNGKSSAFNVPNDILITTLVARDPTVGGGKWKTSIAHAAGTTTMVSPNVMVTTPSPAEMSHTWTWVTLGGVGILTAVALLALGGK